MSGCFLARLADDRYVQAPADCLSNLSSQHALIGNTVILGPSSTFLKRKPVKVSGIESMHSGPAIEAVAYIRRNAFFARDTDQAWHKAVISVAVDRRGKPQHGCADSACCQRKRLLLRLTGEVGIVRILFCCERTLALNEQGAGSDDQRAIRAGKCGA